MKLTKRQKYAIKKYRIGPTRNLSIPPKDIGLIADCFLLLEKHPQLGSFSALVREALRCYLHFGINWRDKNE
jgi:hypothetical protein